MSHGHSQLTEPKFNIWEGIYASFSEAPAVGPGHDGATWRERSILAASDAVAKLAAGETLDYSLRQRNAIMPVVVAMLLSSRPRARILDFGGGLGTAFTVLASALGKNIDRVDYKVVEVGSICRAGRQLFATGTGPHFETELPSAGPFDVVHAASALQYIENWRDILGRLAEYGAPYLILGDLLIGDFASYVTLQNYYDSKIRIWFINAADFVSEVECYGYELALRTECDARILGADGPLPMDNFPPHLRVRRTVHLLFARSDRS